MIMNFQGNIFQTLLICLFVFLQTNLIHRIGGLPVTPDIALILLVFSAYKQGKFKGQLSGLSSGLLMDFLSLSPLGFHALIRTVVGYTYGSIKGKIFIDPVLAPIILVFIAVFIKGFIGSILTGIFLPYSESIFLTRTFFMELGITVVLAPFVLALLQFLKILSINEKDLY